MPNENTKAENSLRKLGERLSQGFAKTNPSQAKNVDSVRNAIREQWAKEKDEREATPPERQQNERDR